MADREKVIKALECCGGISSAYECPYQGSEGCDNCRGNIYLDALIMLKEQEKQDGPDTNVGKWTTERTQEHDGEWYCSKCGYEPIVMSDDMKYCPGCGRKMTMPEPPKEET